MARLTIATPSPTPRRNPNALFKLLKISFSTNREKIISSNSKIRNTTTKVIEKPITIRNNPLSTPVNKAPTSS